MQKIYFEAKQEKGFILALLESLLDESWSPQAKHSAVITLKNFLVNQWGKPFVTQVSFFFFFFLRILYFFL